MKIEDLIKELQKYPKDADVIELQVKIQNVEEEITLNYSKTPKGE